MPCAVIGRDNTLTDADRRCLHLNQ
jgi:hypothetical protein